MKRWVIPERCWFIGPSFGKIILGLGRPRCGILSIDGDDLVHFEIGDGNPIVCGDYTTQDGGSAISILGHSSGAVSWVEGHTEEVKDQNPIGSPWRAPIIEESSAACCILVPGIGSEFITAYENGFIKSNYGWSYDAQSAVSAMAVGPSGARCLCSTSKRCSAQVVGLEEKAMGPWLRTRTHNLDLVHLKKTLNQ